MRIAYFDCFAGCSGNMILGALIDAGCPVDELTRQLESLNLPGWQLRIDAVRRNGFGATLVEVDQAGQARPTNGPVEEFGHGHEESHHGHAHSHEGPPHDDADPTSRYTVSGTGQPSRQLGEILELIDASDLPVLARALAVRIFTRLGEAEARVHRTTLDHVHFHEVGAVDAIIDIVGVAVAVSLLEIDEVHVSPINVGTGTVQAAHGIIPVPGPATAELLAGAPIYQAGPAQELTTPTGAAILTTLASRFGPLPAMTLERVGYGAGSRQSELPNLLRVFLGERDARPAEIEVDSVVVVEANVDDLSPQGWELVTERLFAAGALDVTLAPITMKKQRPATLLSVIAPPDQVETIASVVLRETTTLGVRTYHAQRRCLPRRFETVETAFGPIRLKVASFGDGQRAMPEYDDCKRAAIASGAPLRDVQLAAEVAWRLKHREGT